MRPPNERFSTVRATGSLTRIRCCPKTTWHDEVKQSGPRVSQTGGKHACAVARLARAVSRQPCKIVFALGDRAWKGNLPLGWSANAALASRTTAQACKRRFSSAHLSILIIGLSLRSWRADCHSLLGNRPRELAAMTHIRATPHVVCNTCPPHLSPGVARRADHSSSRARIFTRSFRASRKASSFTLSIADGNRRSIS